MKKVLLTLAAASLAASVFAAIKQTNYSEMTKFYEFVPKGMAHGNMFTADINNDGRQEVIVKGRDLNDSWTPKIKVVYLAETGADFARVEDLPKLDGNNWERIIYPIDYNNDGNIDLIYASSWGSKLLKGNGDGTFTEMEEFALEGEINIDDKDAELWYTGTLGVADFNHDGYADIITFCGNPREDQGTPVVFYNDNGSGKFIKDENTGITAQRGGTLCVGDYNADGNIDVLVTGWANDFGNDCTRIWKNDGKGKFTEIVVGDKAGTEHGHAIFFDLDNNGLLDVFVTGTSCPNNWAYAAWVYKNNGDDTFTQVEVGLTGCQKGGADWCDLNGDGYIDLVYAGEGLENSVYAFNNGDNTFTAVTDKLGKHRGGAVVLAQDINGNNAPDILLMGYRDGSDSHFQVYNGTPGQQTNNKLPQAPSNLKMVADGNKTTFSWDAGSDGDKGTPAAALRYNYYVKTKDGAIITAVPADPATGKLRQGDVNVTSAAKSVTLNIASDKVAEWGVQTIDGAKAASAFATGSLSGIEDILLNEDAPVEYFNIQGIKVSEPANGVYIRRQGSKVEKIVIR